MEIWKEIKRYPSYSISSFGRIKNNKTDTLKAICDNGKGYKRVTLKDRMCTNKDKTLYIHRAVAEAFIVNHKNLSSVNHLDGNKSNNKVDNLEWCSIQDNIKHAVKTGLMHKGESNGNSYLTDDIVRAIKLLSKLGNKADTISNLLGIHKPLINRILRGDRWRHINYF